MIRLLTLTSQQVSTGIRSLSPEQYETIMIENKLLDGSTHIQTIGDPLKFRNFEILSNNIQVDMINQAESIGSKFRLEVDDKYYIGFISKPDWAKFNYRHPEPTFRYFTASIKFTVSEEGSI